MKRKLSYLLPIALFILLFFSKINHNHAQTLRMSLVGGLAAPLNDERTDFKLGYAMIGSVKYEVTEQFGIGVAFGFQALGRGNSGQGRTVGPVSASVDYAFLTGQVQPYVGLDIGLFAARDSFRGIGFGLNSNDLNFGLSPQLGARITLAERWALDVHGRYQWGGIRDRDDYHALLLMAGVVYRLPL